MGTPAGECAHQAARLPTVRRSREKSSTCNCLDTRTSCIGSRTSKVCRCGCRQPSCLTLASPSKSLLPERSACESESAYNALLLAAAATLWAQGVDHSMLLHPPADSWPLYHGTYDGQRHSKLEQITPQNVARSVPGMGVSDQPGSGIKVLPRCWSTGCCTLPSRIRCGRWMPSRVTSYGTTPTRLIRVCILATADWGCSRIGCIFWFRMVTWYRSMPRMAACDGLCRWPT